MTKKLLVLLASVALCVPAFGAVFSNIVNLGTYIGNGAGLTNLPMAIGTNMAAQQFPLYLPMGDHWMNNLHPSIVDRGPGQSWNGWRFWVAWTAAIQTYPEGQNNHVAVSQDGVNFYLPTVGGIQGTNPVVNDSEVPSNLGSYSAGIISFSDSELGLNPNSHMYLFSILDPDGLGRPSLMTAKESTDGVHWYSAGSVGDGTHTVPKVVCDFTQLANGTFLSNSASPEVVDTGTGFRWFWTGASHTGSGVTTLYTMTSTYTPTNQAAFSGATDTGLKIWHGDVKLIGNTYWGIWNTNFAASGPLRFANSPDGTNWTIIADNALAKSGYYWDFAQQYYKPEFETIYSTNPFTCDLLVSTLTPYPSQTLADQFLSGESSRIGRFANITLPNSVSVYDPNLLIPVVSRASGTTNQWVTEVPGMMQSYRSYSMFGNVGYRLYVGDADPILNPSVLGGPNAQNAIYGTYFGIGFGSSNINAQYQFEPVQGRAVRIGTYDGTGNGTSISFFPTYNPFSIEVGKSDSDTSTSLQISAHNNGRFLSFHTISAVAQIDTLTSTIIGPYDGTHPTVIMYNTAGSTYEWDFGRQDNDAISVNWQGRNGLNIPLVTFQANNFVVPNGNLQGINALTNRIVVAAGDYAAGAGDITAGVFLLAGNHKITMMNPSSCPGREYMIVCSSAGTNKVLPFASENFSGWVGVTNTAVDKFTRILSDGANWWVVGGSTLP